MPIGDHAATEMIMPTFLVATDATKAPTHLIAPMPPGLGTRAGMLGDMLLHNLRAIDLPDLGEPFLATFPPRPQGLKTAIEPADGPFIDCRAGPTWTTAPHRAIPRNPGGRDESSGPETPSRA